MDLVSNMKQTMFDDIFPEDWGTYAPCEDDKLVLLLAMQNKAIDILEYNHNKPDGCPGCLQRIMVREMNEIIDELWPLDKTRRAGISYDGATDTFKVHFENC